MINIFGPIMNFRRGLVKEPRHREQVSAKQCRLYRSTRQTGENKRSALAQVRIMFEHAFLENNNRTKWDGSRRR